MTDGSGDILSRVRARQPTVTVIGDVILDRWMRGAVRRLSREAPVPVVHSPKAQDCAGGAANTAANLAALGARVRLVSAVGDDPEGRSVLRLLDAAGVDTSGVHCRPGAHTATKMRIVGDDQIIVRVDRDGAPALSALEREQIVAALDRSGAGRGHGDGAGPDPGRSPGTGPSAGRGAGLGPVDGDGEGDGEIVVACDYGAGLFDEAMRERLGARAGGILIVDAHEVALWRAAHPDVITPNAGEAAALLGGAFRHAEFPGAEFRGTEFHGAEFRGSARREAVSYAAADLLAAAGARAAVVTLDSAGAVVIEGGRVTGHTSAHPMPEQQASGAGDTFTAALALALAVGSALPDAARFAQAAADVVVSRPDTAVCSASDLQRAEAGGAGKVTELAELDERIRRERRAGRTVVFTNGCFDLMHRGHTTHLRQARALGDMLVVAVNDDASVRRLKGPGRPVNPLAERAAVLAELECVDFVISFAEDSPVRLLNALRPDIYTKGGDYSAEMLSETLAVRGYGGEVRILDYLPAHSTSEIIDRISQSVSALDAT